jgi:hypothetical protein
MEQGNFLEQYRKQAPEWANYITADAHGYVKAWALEPKQTPGGLFYSAGMSAVIVTPGFPPEVLSLRPNG